ncbi:MAG: hypothetical protein JNK48_27695 [Bryobacterales bacterium]|nr:hypothetical protein [Bryobacterales bacterium]
MILVAMALGALCLEAQSHYVFFNRERERIAETSFLEARGVAGAQVKYTWRELEPRRDEYDFSAVRKDVEFLTARGKRLFVQLQDSSFDDRIVNVPEYLRSSGAVRQYLERDGKRAPDGWVARRWDAAVRERFHKLLFALGREFDGRIEGINLAETSIGVSRADAADFEPGRYRDAVLDNLRALKKAFPKSVAMQYANFMPGEWLPWEDKGYLRSVYEEAVKTGAGVGGPDLLPKRKGQLAHAYPLLKKVAGKVRTGIAVQEGNYSEGSSVEELLRFARETLRVDYVFWGAEAPYYERDVLPLLARQAGK